MLHVFEDYGGDIAKYVVIKTPYVGETNLAKFLKKLDISASKFFLGVEKNYMKANSDKCHFLLIVNHQTNFNINEN